MISEHLLNDLLTVIVRYYIEISERNYNLGVNKVYLVNHGVNSTARGFSVEDTMTDDSYFNISEIKLSIT